MENKNYRHYSEGYVKVYGNSVEITEEFNAISKEQRHEIIQEEYQEDRKSALRRYDYHLKEHVLEYGHNYHKVSMWYDDYLDRKKEQRKKKEQITPIRKKGDIKGFSTKSRSRMLKKINQLNPGNINQFYHVTLTYPKRFPKDGVTHKADLDAIIKRIKRMFGDIIGWLWKLEFQKRGAPHYHMLLQLPKEYKIEYLRHWFAKNWFEVAQRHWVDKLEEHKHAGTGCDPVDSLRKIGFYITKYLTKNEENTPENQGRYWGCSRNWGELIQDTVKLTGRQLIHFRRLVKGYVRNGNRIRKMITAPMNVTVFGHWQFFLQALEWVQKVH